jgi:hypothetical protein
MWRDLATQLTLAKLSLPYQAVKMTVALQILSWRLDLFASHKESGINQKEEDLGVIMFLMYRYTDLFITGYDIHTSEELCSYISILNTSI